MEITKRLWQIVAGKVKPFFDIDMGGKKIEGLPTVEYPKSDDEATTKQYADERVGTGADMEKATYDPGEEGVVDDTERLSGLSKSEVRDHTPQSHALDVHGNPVGNVSMGGKKIIHLAEPTNPQDIATKAYAETVLGGEVTPPNPPLIAWPYGFPAKCSDEVIQATLKAVRDLGIYQIVWYCHWWDDGWQTDEDYVTWIGKVYDEADDYGMKLYMEIDNRTRIGALSADDQQPFITKMKGKPACAGWFMADEPHCWCAFGGYTMPEADKHYYPYLTVFSWPATGQGLASMLYDLVRGQDNDPVNHPAFNVWLYGFEARCNGDWHSIYNHIYTPGDEIFDVGSVDIYPYALWGEDCLSTLDTWINYSYQFGNEDGFGELGKGMIPLMQAYISYSDGTPGAYPDMVTQYQHWKAKYDKAGEIKAVGFYTPYGTSGFLANNADGVYLRTKIKALATYLGWTGS